MPSAHRRRQRQRSVPPYMGALERTRRAKFTLTPILCSLGCKPTLRSKAKRSFTPSWVENSVPVPEFPDFAQDDWKLFDLQKDFSESTDVAPLHPARLAMMKKAWFREARKYGDLPLAEPAQTLAQRILFQAEFGQ